jgi:hypothetical protein
MILPVKQVGLISGILLLTITAGYGISRAMSKPALTRVDGTHVIELRSTGATPDTIAIVKGSYVQFDAMDKHTYNIGQGSGNNEVHQEMHDDVHEHLEKGIESGTFGPGQGYRVQFNKVGTYDFHDHLNPKISVTVIVYEPKSK